jgi:hypothetical protein
MGGAFLEGRADVGMGMLPEILGATVAIVGAGRELISRRL